tara:strand:- start:78 stop:545 length:468 start_codon:yes stop_codon:yes gene_type:complete
MRIINYLKFLILIYIFFIKNAFSDTIQIESEKLEILKIDGISIFTGNVYAEDKNLKLWSNKLTVYYDVEQESIINIIAEDNVKIIRLDLEAYGNQSNYILKNEELYISGNVTLIENENKIKCEKLFIDIKNSISIMTAGKESRVTAKIIRKENND